MTPLVEQPDGSYDEFDANGQRVASYLDRPIGVGLSGPPPSSNGAAAPLAQRLADARVDLLAHIDGSVPERAWLPQSERMLARGGRHHVAAPLKSGKSIGFLAHAVDMVTADARVVILDRENGADEYARRLRDILADRPAAARDAVRDRLAYYAWPAVKLTDGQQLAGALDGPDVVIIDSTRTFLSALSLDENASDDFATFATAIVEPLFRAGIATVQLDNTGHGDTNRARGSSSKGDLADVLYTLKTVAAFDEQRRGRLRLVRSHSRFGDVAPAFTMELGAGHFGAFAAEHADGATTFRPTELMRRVVALLKAEPGLSKRAIRQAVKGTKNDAKDLALELLIAEGHVRIERDGQAIHHYIDKPFHEPDNPPCLTVPQPCPGTDRDTVPSVPLPVGGGTRHGHGTAQSKDSQRAGHGHESPEQDVEIVWDLTESRTA
jgi:hypothetical protein